jgi:hypothetical protein
MVIAQGQVEGARELLSLTSAAVAAFTKATVLMRSAE